MVFKPINFIGWVEQDVREGIIAKLLERLGYEKGTENDILRGEQLKLEYDREIHGRPKKKTDRPIQSFPDYILEVDKTWRWVIEAKPPTDEIGKKEIWQAYSYAKHHEVRAVMYCVCNGRELHIFRTDFLPEAALVRAFRYEEFEDEFDTIRNILAPEVIRKTWPRIEIDAGKPLGAGLRSFARITGGSFTYKHVSVNHPLLRGQDQSLQILRDLLFTVVSGYIERHGDGRLHAMVATRGPSAEAQRISEDLGIDKLELWSDSSQLSEDPGQPTIFSYSAEYTMPPPRADILGMRHPYSIPCTVNTTVKAYLAESALRGEFEADLRLRIMNQTLPVTIRGSLEAQVV
jgi:hypothetical protein